MEKKKAPISLTGLIVLIIFLAAVVGGLVYFFTNYDLQIMSKDKENEVSQVENKEEIEESKIEELDKDSELVKELYNIVLKYDDSFGSYAWQNEETASFYKDKKITLSSLSNIERMLVIRKNNENMSEISNENDKNKILKDVNFETDLNTGNIYVYPNINKITNKIFNKDVEELNLIKCRGCALDIIYKDDFIYEIEFEGGGMGNAECAYSEIQKVEKIDDRIEIYDKYIYLDFLKAWLPEDDELVHIYTSADKTKEIGKEEDKFVFWDDVNKKEYADKEIFGSVYQKYKDKLNTYKHTFQKSEDGTYYWVSSEIYKKIEDINNLSKEDAEKNAKDVLDKYMDLQHFENGGIGPAPQIFAELGLMSEKEILTLEQNLLGTDPSIYIKSNVEYKKFKDSLLNYVTEDYFERNFSHYTNMDGYVGFCSTAGGIIATEVEKVTLNKIEENKYIFDVILKDIQMYEHYLNPEEGESLTEEDYLFNINITFEYIDGKLLVSEWK